MEGEDLNMVSNITNLITDLDQSSSRFFRAAKNVSGPLISKADEISRAVAGIEGEILALWHQRITLLTQHNDLMPANKLPSEIFSRIFTYCIDWTGEPSVWWVNLWHVCHRWRKVIFEDPTLWARPIIRCPSLAKYMIEHAQDVPLEIFWSSRLAHTSVSLPSNQPGLMSSQMETIALAFSRTQNLKEIDLSLPHVTLYHIMTGISYAPSLEHLALKNSLGRFEQPNMVILYGNTPRIVVPRLQKLEVYGTMFPLSPQPLPFLTSLIINKSFVRVPLPSILEILESAPALSHLELMNALRPLDLESLLDQGVLPNRSALYMRKLRSCILDDNLGHGLLWLIRNLNMPALRHAHISLNSKIREVNIDEFQYVFMTLQEICGGWAQEPWRTLTFLESYSTMVALDTATSKFRDEPCEDRLQEVGPDVEPWTRVSLDFLGAFGQYEHFIQVFGENVRLENVESLYIDAPQPCWTALQRHLPSMQRIHIYHRFINDIIQELRDHWVEKTRDSAELAQIYFIKFIGVDFSSFEILTQFEADDLSSAFVGILINCKKDGMPLRELIMQNCPGMKQVKWLVKQEGCILDIEVGMGDLSNGFRNKWQFYYGSTVPSNA